MAVRNVYVDLDLNQQELRNASFETVTASPGAGLFVGRMVYDTTDQRIKYYDSGAWQSIAHLGDLEQFSTLVGGFDASAGVPQVGSAANSDIRRGDRWYATVGGTIAGLAHGNTVIEVGDMLIAINDVATGTAAPADFIAIQTNADLSSAGLVESIVIASIPANTPTSMGTSFTTLYSMQFFDSTGLEIELSVSRTARTVESNVALTNVTGVYVGR